MLFRSLTINARVINFLEPEMEAEFTARISRGKCRRKPTIANVPTLNRAMRQGGVPSEIAFRPATIGPVWRPRLSEGGFLLKRYVWLPVTLITIITLALAACGGDDAPATAVPKATATTPPVATATVEVTVAATKVPVGGPPREVARNRTLITTAGGELADQPLMWSPYPLGGNQANTVAWFFGALNYFVGTSGEEIPWLAESWEYNDDFTTLTYHIREGAAWRDGVPFTADDVAFTLNSLAECAGKCNLGPAVAKILDKAVARDALTVDINCKTACPKLQAFIAYKGDQGIYIVPKHIFEGKDLSEYSNYEPDKGIPVGTSPFFVVESTIDRRVIDRVATCDEWWACKTGVAATLGFNPLPEMERVIMMNNVPDLSAAAGFIVKDEADITGDLPPQLLEKIVLENEQIIAWGDEKPYGLESWWPLGMMANYEDKHLGNRDVRWAINSSINREQLIEVGQGGQGMAVIYPWPPFPGTKDLEAGLQDITDRFNPGLFDPAEAVKRMTDAGYTKDADGLWTDAGGDHVTCEILGFGIFNDFGPLLAKQLTDAGFDASYGTPPDAYGRMASGDYTCGIWGRTGTVTGDPYLSLALFATELQTEGMKYGYSSPEYDKAVEDLSHIGPLDAAGLLKQTRDVWELYLTDLPDIPLLEFFNTPAFNTTYWTNWPSRDNPHMNGIQVHMGFSIVLYNLKAVQ